MSGEARQRGESMYGAEGLAPAEIHEPELDPPFEIVEPGALRSPIVFSSPHSGNVYPRRFLESARLEPLALRRSEDAHVDALLEAGALDIGAPLLRARFPRAYVDVNREPYELDPRMFEGRLPPYANTRSVRVAGGLGTIARVVGEAQEIYAHRLPVQEAMDRVTRLYEPYHAALRWLLARAQRVFGLAVLIDCHSMPSTSQHGPQGTLAGARIGRADIVVGDRYGASCAPLFVEAIEASLRGRGYLVQRNKPYAGGYITERYGAPLENCHAVQIEVNRALYMDERSLTRNSGFERVAADLAFMTDVLDGSLPRECGERQAAE